MRDITKYYGRNAGKIWVSLNTYGPQSQSSLIKKTKLTLQDFHTGIGWLARENKILKKGILYNLGETNLTNIIGENAGKVWRLLESQGQVDISSIARLSEIKIQDAYSALGWLAREDKIKINGKDKHIKFGIK